MNKGIILYRSKYGTTKRYAAWLAERIGYDVADVSKATVKQVAQYRNIVLCGAIYASGIGGLAFLKKHRNLLHDKNVAIFCVGASPYDEASFEAIRTHNLQGALQNVLLFYGRGAWDESKMKFVDSVLCKLLHKAVAKKDPSTYQPWETALIEASGKVCDWTDKAYLDPLIALTESW